MPICWNNRSFLLSERRFLRKSKTSLLWLLYLAIFFLLAGSSCWWVIHERQLFDPTLLRYHDDVSTPTATAHVKYELLSSSSSSSSSSRLHRFNDTEVAKMLQQQQQQHAWQQKQQPINGNHRKEVDGPPAIKVLLTLYGTGPGFLEEVFVFLKSLLLNSPQSLFGSSGDGGRLDVYMMTNQAAYDVVGPKLFDIMGISYDTNESHDPNENFATSSSSRSSSESLVWWLPVTFYVINVQPYSITWMKEVEALGRRQGRRRRPITTTTATDTTMNGTKTKIPPWKKGVNTAHTEGSFYRLFAHRVLPTNVDFYLYSDSDVVITTDISGLWALTRQFQEQQRIHHDENNNNSNNDDNDVNSTSTLFSWGIPVCSGFMLMRNTAELWNLARKVDVINGLNKSWYYDQDILWLIQQSHPHRVQTLPNEWNFALSWAFRNRNQLLKIRPQLGVGHFNGGGSQDGPWWKDFKGWLRKSNMEEEPNTFATSFLYYVDMPWTQVRFMAQNVLRYRNHPGYPVRAVFIEDPSKWNLSKAFVKAM